MDLTLLLDVAPWDWSEETKAAVSRALQDRSADEEQRTAAAEIAGAITLVDDELVGLLVSIVAAPGESERLRERAAVALGPMLEYADITGFDDPDDVRITERTFGEVVGILERLFFDAAVPELVRRRVLEVAVRVPRDWQKAAIRAAYSSGDPSWKVTAVFAMGHVPGFDDRIVEALGSADNRVGNEAVRAAGLRGVGEAARHVLKLLESERSDRELLLTAIGASVGVCGEDAATVLAELSRSDDEDVAAAAFEALAEVDTDDEPFDVDDDEDDGNEWSLN